MKKRVFKAFTLAEAIITLTLLSVIAAILIPAATNITPSSVKTPFRNAYNITSTTVDNLINNDTIYPASELISADVPIPKGFLYTTTGTKHTYSGSNINAYSETDSLAWEYEALTKNCKCTTGPKLVRSFCCSMNVTSATCDANKCSYTTNNGMTWIATINNNCTITNRTVPIMTVEVDINGSGHPNSASGERPDKYKFNVYYNGKVDLDSTYGSYALARDFLEKSTNNKKKNY